MRKTALLVVLMLSSYATFAQLFPMPVFSFGGVKEKNTVVNRGVVHLNSQQFKAEVFDYASEKEWKFKGKVPVIVDFYADWCRPCKMIAPYLEELQKEYGGKIQIFKIDTDKEQELAMMFGINSIPSLLFIPMEGEPQMITGALPKTEIEGYIINVLKVKK